MGFSDLSLNCHWTSALHLLLPLLKRSLKHLFSKTLWWTLDGIMNAWEEIKHQSDTKYPSKKRAIQRTSQKLTMNRVAHTVAVPPSIPQALHHHIILIRLNTK
ncbi:hypothetical protein AMELA_G00117600, partial [Ameiurus melas]